MRSSCVDRVLPCFRLKNTPFLQLFAEADAWLWEGGHRTRVVVLTDMVDWWFGVHHLATYEDEDGTKRWRNRFQVADRPLREPTAVLSTWLRLREWVKHIDRSMEKTPAGVCLACNGNPSIHRPAISYLTEEQIEAEAKAVGRAYRHNLMTILEEVEDSADVLDQTSTGGARGGARGGAGGTVAGFVLYLVLCSIHSSFHNLVSFSVRLCLRPNT